MVPEWAIPIYITEIPPGMSGHSLPWFAADAGNIREFPMILRNCPGVPLFPARNVQNALEYVHF